MNESESFAEVYESRADVDYPFLHFVREYLLKYPRLFVINRVVHLLLALHIIVPPYLLGVATDLLTSDTGSISLLLVPDSWLPAGTVNQFLLVVGLLGGLVVSGSLLNIVDMTTQAYLRELPKHDLRMDVYAATQELGLEFFEDSQTGDVMSILHSDIETYNEAYRELLNDGTWWALVTVGSFSIMLALHWQAALILVGLLVPVAWVSHRFDARIAPKYAQVRAETGQLNARIEDSISGIETVKTTSNEEHEVERVREASLNRRDASWAASKTNAMFKPLTGMVTDLATIVVFVIGGWWALVGPPAPVLNPLSIGTFVTFFLYTRRFSDRIRKVVDFIDTYWNFRAAAARIHGLLATPVAVPNPSDPVALDDVNGAVAFESVTFRYPGAESPSIRTVSFSVEPGEFVGIVGPTGAGKTTLLKLLMRFYDPTAGTISIDGHDLRDVEIDSLRGRIGYISQEPFLFDGTVRDNIAYGDREATDADIVNAAKRAHAHEFVADMEDGYDTRIGEEGVKLSGGQRQRIAIARAIVQDPDILLLDEATSHVDNKTELLIQSAIDDILHEKTIIAVAHSLSTVKNADRIVVLEDGELADIGCHDTLVTKDGIYARLWAAHVGNARDRGDRRARGETND